MGNPVKIAGLHSGKNPSGVANNPNAGALSPSRFGIGGEEQAGEGIPNGSGIGSLRHTNRGGYADNARLFFRNLMV